MRVDPNVVRCHGLDCATRWSTVPAMSRAVERVPCLAVADTVAGMVVHLLGERTSVVVDLSTGVPTIRHWGARIEDADVEDLLAAVARPVANGTLGVEAPISIVPEHGSGFPGRPGLAGHRRRGTDWASRFTYRTHTLVDGVLTAIAVDEQAALTLVATVSLADALSVRLRITNDSPSERYLLDRLDISLPLPAQACELMQFTGRWAREMHPYRTAFDRGTRIAENRTGRTSHENIPLVFAGTAAFGEWSGEVWGAHLAWSGNHHVVADVLPDGRRLLQLGELFHPGELSLAPGEHYESPELIAVYSAAGLTEASWGFHRTVRRRERFTTPRPVLLNTWEAVYFDHDNERLRRLADVAASLGVERFVLDDGWFGSRRDDTSGLGDWTVSADAHPDGLEPLITHVRGLGMEFGIWVEPEMVNPDSDLHRAHPDWTLTTQGYEPVLGRNQLVLNLAHPDAYAHILDVLDTLLRDHDIAFVKWDMNRAHSHGSGVRGAAGTHDQTLALYRLIDELRTRHPDVEIESCSSGGGRIDHEILRRTDRVWTSDCNDALERQAIQRGASMFIPPEVMGAHIGPTRSHTTGRHHSFGFRAATALFGHLGIEWNVLDLDERERAALTRTIETHKRFRDLLHHGDSVRFDPLDEATIAHGVYRSDRSEALISVARVATAMSLVPAPVRLPGLDPDGRYRIERIVLSGTHRPSDLDGTVMSGRLLATAGIQLPVINPESALLLRLHRI